MHEALGPNNFSTEILGEALVPKANAEDWLFSSKSLNVIYIEHFVSAIFCYTNF